MMYVSLRRPHLQIVRNEVCQFETGAHNEHLCMQTNALLRPLSHPTQLGMLQGNCGRHFGQPWCLPRTDISGELSACSVASSVVASSDTSR